MARAHPASVAALAVCLAVAGGAVARAQTTGTLQGTVVDARDGTPLEKVSVRIQDTPLVTITTSDGRFLLENVPSGHRELYVSAVDFVLTRRGVEIPAGEVLEITIPIAAGTGTYTETVNVSSAAGADARSAGGGQVLRSNELQQLRGVITNDPMRAIHVLPGVATGDDLRSEFSVRGLPVRNMNFTFEGISTPLLVHTVQGVQDGGSIAMVNGDVLEEIALSPGAYVERHGNHTGAELNFLVREGSRDRLQGPRPPQPDGHVGRHRGPAWLDQARVVAAVGAKKLPGRGHSSHRSRKHLRLRVPRFSGEAGARRQSAAPGPVCDHRRPVSPGTGRRAHRHRRCAGRGERHRRRGRHVAISRVTAVCR